MIMQLRPCNLSQIQTKRDDCDFFCILSRNNFLFANQVFSWSTTVKLLEHCFTIFNTLILYLCLPNKIKLWHLEDGFAEYDYWQGGIDFRFLVVCETTHIIVQGIFLSKILANVSLVQDNMRSGRQRTADFCRMRCDTKS